MLKIFAGNNIIAHTWILILLPLEICWTLLSNSQAQPMATSKNFDPWLTGLNWAAIR